LIWQCAEDVDETSDVALIKISPPQYDELPNSHFVEPLPELAGWITSNDCERLHILRNDYSGTHDRTMVDCGASEHDGADPNATTDGDWPCGTRVAVGDPPI
jgi:hypothetical protein